MKNTVVIKEGQFGTYEVAASSGEPVQIIILKNSQEGADNAITVRGKICQAEIIESVTEREFVEGVKGDLAAVRSPDNLYHGESTLSLGIELNKKHSLA
jgi:hypothetical protein